MSKVRVEHIRTTKRPVSEYFEDWSNEVVHGDTTKNWSGQQVNDWTILEFIGPEINKYEVQCKCGKKFIRNIYSIITHRSSKCHRCGFKNGIFKTIF
jgi:hypothetical protein